MKRKIRINFSDFWHPDTVEAKRSNPIYLLLSQRFELEICEQPDFLIYSVFGVDFIKYDCTRIFYTGENKRPNYTHCDWAFGFDFSQDPRYLRWPYYAIVDRSALLQPRDVDALLTKKTHFCAFIYSNERAKERVKFLDKLSRYKPVDCGGKVRNNLGYRVGDKVTFLQTYKFDVTFENESYPGYTTEKLPEAFAGNTVPIYWGNPRIEQDFNTGAFVNCHDFRSLDQVVECIIELDRNDDLYRKFLGAPIFPHGKPTEFTDADRVLDRFDSIFESPPTQPVAKSLTGRTASLLLEPRRQFKQWRAQYASKRSA